MKEKHSKIGLFFGSFNPVHVGHMVIANFMATQTDLEEVWLVISPHNPLKPKKSLANDYDRLHLVQLAIGDNPHLKASTIEFGLPQPSFTIDTLTYLKEKFPDKQFVPIMGGDNLTTLHKWKNYELLLRDYELYVYNRPTYNTEEFRFYPNIKIVEAPLMQISSTYIRKCIKDGKSVQYLLTEPVYEYLLSSHLYR